MDKLKMETTDITDKNISEIGKIFPNVITETKDDEGKMKKVVDFDLLRQILSETLVEDENERYRLDWPGKKASLLKANTPINKTLRPVVEESVDFENTENLFIEGDNFEVLKILQESYLGKIKMIYIDPPYNTGSDFIYRDNFAIGKEQYAEETGAIDEEGDKLFKNTDSNGRFHSDWLSMMYERLVVARDLLKNDGIIFISIDDNEVHNLRKICEEIFGEENFLANVIWEKKFSPQNDAKYFSDNHDHILVFAKNKENCKLNLLPRTKEQDLRYKNLDNDARGNWTSSDLTVRRVTEKDIYEIKTPSGKVMLPTKGRSWIVSKEKFELLKNDNRIWFGENGDNVPRLKRFLTDVKNGIVPLTIFKHSDVGHNQEAQQELKKIFEGESYFDSPKPIRLLNRILHIGSSKNDIILDFFSGSGTTAHAVMKLNAEDGGKRKFIMVQLPEKCDEKSEAFKAGYKTIAEIGKERIRRAGKKVVSGKWSVISEEEKIKYGCKELSRTDCMAKGNGIGQNNLFDSEKITEGGNLQSVRSDETSSGIDTFKYSGGTSANLNQRISTLSGNSKGIKSGTGNTTSSMCESGIPCRYGYFGSDTTLTGDREDGVCSFKNTNHCPLTTAHCLDIGFRVYKVDSTNMKDVYYHPEKLGQEELDYTLSNIKEDRTPEDLLTQVILDLGLELSLPIEKQKFHENDIFIVQKNALVACFDNNINFKIIDEIAKLKPFRVVFKDASFKDDKDRINVEERFKRLSPETVVKVI